MATKCQCLYNCPDGVNNGTCYLQPGGYCFTVVQEIFNQEKSIYENETTYGCLPPEDGTLFQCKSYLSPHQVPRSIVCCNEEDYCNLNHIPTHFHPDSFKDYINDNDYQLSIKEASCIVLLLFFIIFLIFLICKLLKRLKKTNIEFKDTSEIFEKTFDSEKLLFNTSIEKPYPYSFNALPHILTVNNNSSDSVPSLKYVYLNNNSSNSNSNGSNYTFFSENTQQTILSKLTSINSLPPVEEDSFSSGSGSGNTRLVQQTLAREIHLLKCIGNGRFGNVWLGIRQGENVAVKIFFSRDEASWKREIEIYSTVIMRHENILGFFGADVTSENGFTQLWLVTDYCELGSLYDYLYTNTVKDVYQMLSLMKSIIFGISHLHTEVIGTLGKPAIAHRDIKSKNILMKSNFSCCIADFGLAVTKTQTNSKINIAQNHRVGTKRYMAPEVLNETIKNYLFESFCSADIYSLGLVFWEIINRLEVEGFANEYSVPYKDLVPPDPAFEDMRQVVCIEQKRPQFTNTNSINYPFQVSKLISECWSQNPSARLTSLRIKKSIINMF